MTHTSVRVAVCLLLTCCVLPLMAQNAASADSVVPGMVKFAGTLNDVNGKPLTGTVGVTFLLYKEQSGGTPLWTETQNVQTDKNGHYSVMLGSTTSHGIPADAFAAGQARWMGVQPSGQAEQARVELGSVPYALKAADAQTLGGLPPSAFLLASPATSMDRAATAEAPEATTSQPPTGTKPVTTAGGTAKALAKFDGTADIANSQIVDDGTNVGVGTKTPKAKLDVKGGAIVRGLLNVPPVGKATSSEGKNSQPVNLSASAFNSTTGTATDQNFRWQAEPVGNNTANTDGTLNLLYSAGSNPPAETGVKVASNGKITFAPGQTFPGTGAVSSVGLSAPSSEFSVTGSPITTSGTLGLQWKVAPASANVANAIVKRDGSGNFSAGAITASALTGVSDLHVNFFEATQIAGQNSNTSPGFAPIIGTSTAQGAVDGYGVSGFAQSLNGAGVTGRNSGGRGVWGQSTGGSGVFGESFGPGSGSFGFGPDGVDGVAHDNSGIGVFGYNLGNGTGVFAKSTEGVGLFAWGGTDGTTGQGIIGESTGQQISASGFGPDGVDGISHSDLGSGVAAVNTAGGDGLFAQSSTGFAAFFLGDVDVDGRLSKAAGSFKIDHPLDPANKYLYHSFVESPDMKNIYDGIVSLDASGAAAVELPEWFGALNRDFRYQLTAVGAPAPGLYIAQKVQGNRFKIAGGQPGMEVSWQVTGIRQDAYANANRIPVEEAKPENERGLYLHPELFGAPPEKSIAAIRHSGAMKMVREHTSLHKEVK